MRPYHYDLRMKRGFYRVPQWGRPDVFRPNRASAGLSATRDRSRSSREYRGSPARITEREKIVLGWLVFGTTDKLRGGLKTLFTTKQTRCASCGSYHGRLRLTDAGRARLEALRRRKNTG